MQRTLFHGAALMLTLTSLAACSNDRLLNGAPSAVFQQVDRVGRPAIVEIYSPFANHDKFARSLPSGDTATIGADIGTFVTGTAGRSSATVTYVQGLLTPDVLIADFSQSVPASYLGVETQGKLNGNGTVAAGGGLFGGRALTDDVITADLGLAFGSTAALLGGAPDDGNELDGRAGRPNLATDHVAASATAYLPTFPYLADPH
ncbi:MAG: DUF4331 family protein [Vulcanimicrobiaceae bacterium]